MEIEEYIPLVGASVEVNYYAPREQSISVEMNPDGTFPVPESAAEFLVKNFRTDIEQFISENPKTVSYSGEPVRFVDRSNLHKLLIQTIYEEFTSRKLENLLTQSSGHSIEIKNTNIHFNYSPYESFNSHYRYRSNQPLNTVSISVERVGRGALYLDTEKHRFINVPNKYAIKKDDPTINFIANINSNTTNLELQNILVKLVKDVAVALADAHGCAPLTLAQRGYATFCKECPYQLQCVTVTQS